MDNLWSRLRAVLPCRERVWDWPLYRWQRWLRAPRVARAARAEAHFFAALCQQAKVALSFDVGANLGFKTALLASLGQRVIALEPDPENCRRLMRRFRGHSRIVVLPVGVGSEAGTQPFQRFGCASTAFNTFSTKWTAVLGDARASRFGANMLVAEEVQVPITTLDAVIAEHGRPDFIKIDVEGYEFEVLKGLSTPVSLLSFECNLPEFAEETLGCLSHLQALSPAYRYNLTCDEPPARFALPRWVNAEDMRRQVGGGEYRFMEVYASLSHGSPAC
jgi:FkbM family methyltransferase